MATSSESSPDNCSWPSSFVSCFGSCFCGVCFCGDDFGVLCCAASCLIGDFLGLPLGVFPLISIRLLSLPESSSVLQERLVVGVSFLWCATHLAGSFPFSFPFPLCLLCEVLFAGIRTAGKGKMTPKTRKTRTPLLWFIRAGWVASYACHRPAYRSISRHARYRGRFLIIFLYERQRYRLPTCNGREPAYAGSRAAYAFSCHDCAKIALLYARLPPLYAAIRATDAKHTKRR